MKAKQYFWNKKHHKELDIKMGLTRRMPEQLAKLAEACGINPTIDGTKALIPIFLFNKLDKILPEKMRQMITYKYFSNEPPHKFYRQGFSKN